MIIAEIYIARVRNKMYNYTNIIHLLLSNHRL